MQKVSSGFSWSSDHASEANIINNHNLTVSKHHQTEKEKIKKLDSDSKSSPNTPANQQDSNFTLSPISASNLDTMPVPGGVQGQNPTQGHYQKDFEIFADFMFAFPLRTCPLDERSYGRAHDVKYTSRPRRRNALHVERLS